MDQKKFKSIRESVLIKKFDAGQDTVEVKQTLDCFDIFVNGQKVESFKTKDTALEIAEEAAKAIGN